MREVVADSEVVTEEEDRLVEEVESFGPPAQVFEMGTFMHATEGEMVCESVNAKIPFFNAPIYLENKTSIGKVDEILGPINQVYFTIKPQEGIQATSFKKGDKFYIGGDKLLPLEKFLPKPKPPPGAAKTSLSTPYNSSTRAMSRRAGLTNGGEKQTPAQPKDNAAQSKQAMLLSSDSGHFSLIRALHLADLITELNGFCGFMSILSSMRYCLADPSDLTNLWLAFGFMPFGLFFDFFDGKVARWREKSSLMGQELDSLADLVRFWISTHKFARIIPNKPVLQVTFGVATAAAGFAMGFRTTVDQIFLAFYVLCGLTRLARFNVTVAMLPKDKTGKSKYFEGTPIPFACLLSLTMMTACTWFGWIHEDIPLGTIFSGTGLEFHPIGAIFLINGILMTSRTLHVPKP
ncbi:H/ACA ribonucleoprotein complex subunit 1 [Fonsecaea multimorphosa]|nr:H/ACA ribonucleoprotein complex subunit 1 [Fonsecaea multimorphosa]